jgi:DNA-binding MarR family transcriptional regulator
MPMSDENAHLQSNEGQFLVIIRKWSEVFMKRSMRDFKHFMDDSGLSPSQISTLMRLNFRGGCGVSDIAEHVGITNAAASQLIDRMVNMSLIERVEDPLDRRAKLLSLTVKGKALVEDGIAARQRWMELLTSALTLDEQNTIAAALTMLTAAAQRLEEKEQA